MLLSFYVSQDLLDLATTDELGRIRISVDNFQDFDDLNVPIHSPDPKICNNIDNNITKNLKVRTMYVNDDQLSDDFYKLADKNDRIHSDEIENLHTPENHIY